MPGNTLKVSVIVPTYCPGKGLDRVIKSLDRQSLPVDEWEAIFVDDGSPDDTFARLQKLAKTRPNMRITRIENSGWPSRPRNVGTDLARGEYVTYLDHDDELYPDALRDGYAFAARAHADVLSGKEARTHSPGFAVERYTADSLQVKDETDVHPLIPANPHKLYRRAFLDEHGIRFREGGRVLWEDAFFNVLVAKHADVIARMSSTPFYHWYATEGSGTTTFRRGTKEWWDWFEELIRTIDTELAGDELAVQRDLWRRHQYQLRLLGVFDSSFAKRPAEERSMMLTRARQLQRDRFPVEDDVALSRGKKMRAQLLRAGEDDLLTSLSTDDPGLTSRPRVTRARWQDGVVTVDVTTKWANSRGRRAPFKVVDGRVLRNLPDRYDGVFDTDLLDLTDDIAGASVALGVRSQKTRINWMVPTTSEVHWKRQGTRPEFTVTGTGTIDPKDAAMGRPLSRGIWHVTVRSRLGMVTDHRMGPGMITPAIEIDEKGSAAVYTRPDGKVVLDFDETGQPLESLRLRHRAAAQVRGATREGSRQVRRAAGWAKRFPRRAVRRLRRLTRRVVR